MTPPLLDTHVWIWWVAGEGRALGPGIGAALDALPPDARPAISDFSLWEAATLAARGRLALDRPLDNWLRSAASPSIVELVPLTPEIAAEIARLPDSFTRDPADRVIVATSRVLDRPLVTRDRVILRSRLTKRWNPRG